jgi:hypothetical protein
VDERHSLSVFNWEMLRLIECHKFENTKINLTH